MSLTDVIVLVCVDGVRTEKGRGRVDAVEHKARVWIPLPPFPFVTPETQVFLILLLLLLFIAEAAPHVKNQHLLYRYLTKKSILPKNQFVVIFCCTTDNNTP